MKKSVIYLLALSMSLVACSTEGLNGDASVIMEQQSKDPLTPKQINAIINQHLSTGEIYNWSTASTHVLWSAIQQGDNLASIGFGSSYDRSQSADNKAMEQEIISIIEKYEGIKEDRILQSDETLTQIDVVIEKQETLEALRKIKNIRYIEPSNYRYFAFESQYNGESNRSSSESGCGFEEATLSTVDYTTITPNAKAPWSFAKHKITNAWAHSTGAGITVGVIDTGVSTGQTLLGSSFNNGNSTGRTISKRGVYVDSIWSWTTGYDGPADQCGHGTAMTAALAAPRNTTGMPVGVAYNANVIAYRAASNVVLDGYHEQEGVKLAFTQLGDTSALKIISMSMGHVFSVGKIEDGVKYAYSKGKLIFTAGGTSTSFTNFVGVIFPASMAEVVAVTGVKENTSNQKCDVCHSGGKIEFTYQMERASGKHIPVLSYYNGKTDYVGGSSVATASTAGIAALVWSKNKTWTRAQVLNKMRQSATYYPTKNASYGYGNIDALKAVQ